MSSRLPPRRDRPDREDASYNQGSLRHPTPLHTKIRAPMSQRTQPSLELNSVSFVTRDKEFLHAAHATCRFQVVGKKFRDQSVKIPMTHKSQTR